MSVLTKYINSVRALQFLQLFRFVVLLMVGIVLSKTNIGIGQIGTYETFLLISGAVCFFWIGGMLQAMLSQKKESVEAKSPVYFNIFLIISILGVVAATCVFLLQGEIARFVGFSGGHIPYLKLLVAYIVLSCPVNLVEYIYLIEDKPKAMLAYALIMFPLQLLATILPIVFTDDLGYGIYGLVLANFLKFIWLCVVVLKYSAIRVSFGFAKDFIKLSAPLILSVLLVKGIQYADSFLVSYKYDESSYAQFRYGAKEFPLILLALTAFAEAMTSRFANDSDLEGSLLYVRTENKRLMNFLVPIAIVSIAVSKFFYPLLFNEDFEECAIVFNIFCLTSMFRFIIPNSILVGKRHNNPILLASLVNLIVNVVLGLLLMNLMGILGVAIAFLFGTLIEKLILVAVVRKLYGIRLGDYLDIRTFLFYMVLMLVCVVVSFFV